MDRLETIKKRDVDGWIDWKELKEGCGWMSFGIDKVAEDRMLQCVIDF